MKNLILFFIVVFTLTYCKKKDDSSSPSISQSTAPTSELSSPLFDTEYGDAYDHDDIGRNPITILSSNHMIVSSIHYNGMIDKLQISKINMSGGLLWQKTFTDGYRYKSGQCFETSSGNLIVIGATIASSSWVASKVFIAKLNPLTGDTIWTKKYGHNYIDEGIVGYENINANYWIVDYSSSGSKATLLKVNSNGDSLTSIIDSSQPGSYKDVLITANKEIVLVGESPNAISSKRPVYIAKYTNGVKNFSSDIILNNFDDVQVSDICQTVDGNFVISGTCLNNSNTRIR
jgi:hypothetical protein